MGKRLAEIVLAALLVGATAAGVASAAPAEATAAYRETFGPPPEVEAGRCLAAVAYLPGVGTSGDAGRLGPLPLFSVNPERVLHEAARVLVQGHPVKVRLFEPPRLFPEGTALDGLEIAEGVATVRVSTPAGRPHPLALQALAATLAQFPNVDAVRLALGGTAPSAPTRPDPARQEPPPPPRLLDVVASVHPGEEPQEIDVLFDRPLAVETFRLTLGDGTGLPGRTYTSMFDMAVVYRPEDPKILREGLPLALEWSVVDKTGRRAEGKTAIGLRVYRHPE